MVHRLSLSTLAKTASTFAPVAIAAIAAVAASGANAANFELDYTGNFATTEALNLATASMPTYFAAPTPFSVRAIFSDAVNLAPPFGGPFDGFRAYAPSSLSMTIGGKSFTIDPSNGVTVAIFDQFSFDPGHYAVGLLVDPFNDGAGIVGDFVGATPNFTAAALTPTLFTDFYGVGHEPGLCVPGSILPPPLCDHQITPWLLYDNSHSAYLLTLGSFEVDYPVAHSPGAGTTGLETAQLLAVPEPASLGLALAGLCGLGVAIRRRPA